MGCRTGRKLLTDEKVEVRSSEDGCLGSWGTGIVISYRDMFREVRYDHLLNDEGSCNLVEWVQVSPVVDGIDASEVGTSDNYRGFIRPLPPSDGLGLRCPYYGQCVDMFYEDAWWEGVIFDHDSGCEQRRIFFPDMGDEMEAKIDTLRLTRDWDEVSEEWKPRGNWLFLELIEEFECDLPLPVSVKQIWYEVRVKNGFEKLSDWTSSRRDIWRELMKQVLSDNLKITVKHIFKELNSSLNSSELGDSSLQFSEQTFDDVLKNDVLFHSSLSVVPFEATSQFDIEGIPPPNLNNETDCQSQEDNDQCPATNSESEEAHALSVPALPILSYNPDGVSVVRSKGCNQAPDRSFELGHGESTISTQKDRNRWQPAVPELVSGAEFCPNDIVQCKMIFQSGKRPPPSVMTNARKHLLYLDWKVEFSCENSVRRFRYTSLDGEQFFSMRQICLQVDFEHQNLGSGSQTSLTYNRNVPMISLEETVSPSPSRKPQQPRKLSKLCNPSDEPTIEPMIPSVDPIIEPKYCPEAVGNYYSYSQQPITLCCEKKLKADKAKQHLSALGWQIYYKIKGTKRELRYRSTNGDKTFFSLRSACKWCLENGVITSSEPYPNVKRIEDVKAIEEFDDHMSISKSHCPLVSLGSQGSISLENEQSEKILNESFHVSAAEGEVIEAKMLRKRGKSDKTHCNEGSELSRRGRKRRALMKITEDMGACSSTPVRRSGKRIRNTIPSSSKHTPRTILSLLIDNNILLPRSKVYCGRNESEPPKEGRVAREGIKCSCCGETFSLSKFEAHAGRTNHRPSETIFLEDGRSLLDCQLQLKQQKNNGCLMPESHQRKARQPNKMNDSICSICHYGGDLLLCDQCPSAFHIHCIGLKGIPDGDWFCPPCCCQICGQGNMDCKNGRVAESLALICRQCEQRYHVECLRNKGISEVDCHPEGHWFCQDTCKQIFFGLCMILGKPIAVGIENMTWTLVKYDRNASYDKHLTENYSKLNVALSVMHECFEPVREPGTKRDLVEDVIFSRWSELKRLNFQGFYTVLLEKNDELISAANVRIFGKKVAEVPLVATRFQYRRLGMCRVLMNELEENLKKLGVERLVLPAVPSVLNTWTTSFGFSVMNETERLNFLHNIFLDFPGTVICQKILTSNPSSMSRLSTGTQLTSCGRTNKIPSIKLDGNSAVSEVFQVDQVGETDISEYGSTGIATGKTAADNENGNCSDELAIVVNVDQSTLSMSLSPPPTSISLDCPTDVADHNQDEDTSTGFLICYKRRKVSAC